MKKCPVCHQTITGTMILRRKVAQSMPDLLGEHFTDGKGVIRCPHCKSRLRKKISVWFIPAMIPFVVSVWLYTVNPSLKYTMIISIVFFMLFYISLPYVPYDKK